MIRCNNVQEQTSDLSELFIEQHAEPTCRALAGKSEQTFWRKLRNLLLVAPGWA